MRSRPAAGGIGLLITATNAATFEESTGDGPVHIVVMGVSGSGKSTSAHALVDRLGWEFGEGDDFHPPANLEKMRLGHPLTDDDRWPWLTDWTKERDDHGASTIVTCSALRRAYRDVLREGGHTYFLHLVGDRQSLLDRMHSRQHFMPASLLDSQFRHFGSTASR